MLFRGTFEHSLDAKHRLTIPAKFRAALGSGVVLAKSPEVARAEDPSTARRSISVWPAADYEAWVTATLKQFNPLDPRAREMKRFFFNSSHDTELDSANRVTLPRELLRYASLDKELVVAGSGECLEIWDRETYYSYEDDVMNRIPDIAASLGEAS